MKLQLSPRAIEEYNQAVDYSIEHFGVNVARKFVKELKDIWHLLADNPYMGAVEPALIDEKYNYRYWVIHPYKMIYYVDVPAATIYIVTFFDTRQNQEKLPDVIGI